MSAPTTEVVIQSNRNPYFRTYAMIRAFSDRSRIVDSPEIHRRTVRSLTLRMRVAYWRAESPDAATAAMTSSESVGLAAIGLPRGDLRVLRAEFTDGGFAPAVCRRTIAKGDNRFASLALRRVVESSGHRSSPFRASFIALPWDDQSMRAIALVNSECAAVPQPEHPTP